MEFLRAFEIGMIVLHPNERDMYQTIKRFTLAGFKSYIFIIYISSLVVYGYSQCFSIGVNFTKP
jgi:hypothetical protein